MSRDVNNRHVCVVDDGEASLAYLDRDLSFIWINAAFEKAFGCKKHQLIGRSFADFLPNPHIIALLENVRDTASAYKSNGEPLIYSNAAGETVTHTSWTLAPLMDREGSVRGIALSLSSAPEHRINRDNLLANLREEAEKWRLEAELKTEQLQAVSERIIANMGQMEAIISCMTDGLLTFDLDGNILSMNPAAMRIHGLTNLVEAQVHVTELRYHLRAYNLDGSLMPAEEWPIMRVLRGDSFTGYEVLVRRDDTGAEWIGSYSGGLVCNIDDEPFMGVLTLRDITALRRTQMELEETNDRLNSANEELASTNEELMTANEELSTLNEELNIANEELNVVNEELRSEIDRRLAAEEALRELAQRLDSHMQNSPLAVIEWDPNYRIMRWSEEAEHLFGWSAEEMFGKRIDEVRWVHEADWPRVAGLMADMDAGSRSRNVNPNRNYCKDGSIIWCEWYNSVLMDEKNNVESVLSLVLDVTRREFALQEMSQARAEAERRTAEMESFFSSAAEGLAIFDADANMLLLNDAGRAIFGYAPGEIPSNWLERSQRCTMDGVPIPPELLPISRSLKTGEVVRDMRMMTVQSDGREIYYSVSSAPVRNSEGHIVGGVSIFRDVREQVELERRQEELFEREHHISQVLQQALIPPQLHYNIYGCRIGVKYQPALREAEVGGDFYDVFDLGGGKIGVLIGDIAGKGLPAAIRVASVRYAIRSYIYLDSNPAKAMTLTNDALCREEDESFGLLTALLAVIDTQESVVTYVSAGHEPPLILNADGDVTDLEEVGGCALGIAGNINYVEFRCKIKPGDMIIALTDGVIEARSGSDLFGRERIAEYLSQTLVRDPCDVALGLLEAAKAYAGGSLQDDAAIVAFVLDH